LDGHDGLDGRDLTQYTPERIGMLSMLCLVVVFGVHSFVDWTWYVPGDAYVALLCAGWLAGRGPLNAWRGDPAATREWSSAAMTSAQVFDVQAVDPAPAYTVPAGAPVPGERRTGSWARGPRSLREVSPMRVGVAVCAVIAALLAAWSQWQPQRSVNASQEALDLLAANPKGALAKAQTGVARDPLSAQALITLSTIEQDTGEPALAQATLQRAVRLQPSNPQTWLALARHNLASKPVAALKELQAGIYLNPESIAPEAIAPPYPNPESVEIYNDYVQALRATTAAGVVGASRTGSGVGRLGATGARRRSRGLAGISGPPTSAIARPGQAAAAARRAARLRRALRLPETRAPRAAG
jgi:hypothetical protein